jgi:hypothetical protein
MSAKLRRSTHKRDPEDSINNIYDVEKILAKKYEAGRLLYLVKWLDYPESQNTWEPLTHLTEVPELIEEFEKEQLDREESLDLDERSTKSKKSVNSKPPCGNVRTDTAKRFKNAKRVEDKVYILVEWRERVDGIQPLDTYVLNKNLREKYGNMLLDFYEERLKFNNKYN